MGSKYEKEFFERIVSQSINIKDVARNLGIGTTYGNRKTIKNYIRKYEIDVNHFYVPRCGKIPKKFSLETILVENSTYTHTTTLKNRLYAEGIKKRQCELCGQDENWHGSKISLILDHKNGVNNDNRIENLRIVCPNCNAAQETFCRGTKKKKNKISKQRNLMEESLRQRKVERPPVDLLRKEIKELGYLGTGRKYGVSDNAIRKWLKFYETKF